MPEALTLFTAQERPELVEAMLSLGASPWPEFLNHDAIANLLWGAGHAPRRGDRRRPG